MEGIGHEHPLDPLSGRGWLTVAVRPMNTTLSISTRADHRGRFHWHIQSDQDDDVAGSAPTYEEQMEQVNAALRQMAEATEPIRIHERLHR